MKPFCCKFAFLCNILLLYESFMTAAAERNKGKSGLNKDRCAIIIASVQENVSSLNY